MHEKINEVWDAAIAARRRMIEAGNTIADAEATAVQDDMSGYMACKNGEQRRAFIDAKLAEDEGYHAARREYRSAKQDYALWRLEIERWRMLIDAPAVELQELPPPRLPE